MGQVIAVPIDDSSDPLLVEIHEAAGPVPAARPGEILGTAAENLESVFARVRPAVQAVARQIRALPEKPDRVTVTFGITFSAEAGVIIARTASNANFALTVEWSRPMTNDVAAASPLATDSGPAAAG